MCAVEHSASAHHLHRFSPGYDEDHSNVSCRFLAKQKKSVRSAGDVTGCCLGGPSLCPPGKRITEVHFSR